MAIIDALDVWLDAKAVADMKERRLAAYNVGQCVKASWYVEHGYRGAPMGATGKLSVERGKAFERMFVAMVVEAIPGARPADWQTDRVPLDIFERPIIADLFVPTEDHAAIPCDVKSVHPYVVKKAQAGEVDEKYQAQLECYARAYKAPYAIFWPFAADGWERAEVRIYPDVERWERIRRNVEAARAAESPARPFTVDEDGFIPDFPCGYCGYRDECWPDLEEATEKGRYGKVKTRHRCKSVLVEQLQASLLPATAADFDPKDDYRK